MDPSQLRIKLKGLKSVDRHFLGDFVENIFQERKIIYTLILVKLNMPVHGIFINYILKPCLQNLLFHDT
jgi:hypothetical protein